MEKYKAFLSDEINYYVFEQYLFFSQWKRMREYVNSIGIEILGDMPIYVAPDSADVWANPRSFQLDRDRRPSFVAGVPPDYFSEDGQKWGNPLYDWKYMKNHGYDFFVRRAKAASELFDSVRLDHFIGFANYYSVAPRRSGREKRLLARRTRKKSFLNAGKRGSVSRACGGGPRNRFGEGHKAAEKHGISFDESCSVRLWR